MRKNANWLQQEHLKILASIDNSSIYYKILEEKFNSNDNVGRALDYLYYPLTINSRTPSNTFGAISSNDPQRGKMTYWMMDYALHKSVKILPKDERKIELAGGIIVDLDDPDLSDMLQVTRVYEYPKDEAGVGAKTNITTRSISFENCSEGQIPCEKVEKKTEKTPEWLRSFEGICDFIGARSNDIYNLLKFFGLDNIL